MFELEAYTTMLILYFPLIAMLVPLATKPTGSITSFFVRRHSRAEKKQRIQDSLFPTESLADGLLLLAFRNIIIDELLLICTCKFPELSTKLRYSFASGLNHSNLLQTQYGCVRTAVSICPDVYYFSELFHFFFVFEVATLTN
jgi:hypothetical protein